MVKLEEVVKGAQIRGILANQPVTIVEAVWHGTDVREVFYRRLDGATGSDLLYRETEAELSLEPHESVQSFTGDGAAFRLAFEALRIRLAHLFDPLLAVHSSQIMPLPHQITAVYQEMLPRQPLRFLLADDPGAGKTVMAGLFLKELMARGDLKRCLIVCPGSLVEQWQEELRGKFDLPFTILTNDGIEAAYSGNYFDENHLVIARLDKLSRDEDLQERLRQTEWDVVVCDEAHKMSAHFYGNEVKPTKRYKLGQLLSGVTRHFLLMTATPHNGKEADFQLFLQLLDPDRFEGKFREGAHGSDVSDIMRRLVKEKLLKFDGTPLFQERRAYTVPYNLSPDEQQLYEDVSEYVQKEFNRADHLASGKSRRNVGLALTTLQRRLASSPEAIYQSLRRRRENMEKRLREEQEKQVAEALAPASDDIADLSDEEFFDETPDAEREALEDQLLDKASAAQTVTELRVEIATLTELERLALRVKDGGMDRKWDELSGLLQNRKEMFDAGGTRRKLVIFTEHRDTLNYLTQRIGRLLGQPEAVAAIHGGMGRDERRASQEGFTQDKTVQVLVATDAAGEGINLQRAHLMVNYDLPWNPNRLEQRFGRIHRIGQEEVCHLWNLVANQTREGDVYRQLLEKIEIESAALNGAVFDVLGELVFEGEPLWKLLEQAVRYGNQPEVRARLFEKVEGALNREHLQELIEKRALVDNAMDFSMIQRVREEMERAEARRLQPHFVEGFFLAALAHFGGAIRPREGRRYEVTHVPGDVRRRPLSRRETILGRYERVTFERGEVSVAGKPQAALLCPGHALLDAVVDLTLDRYRPVLRQGAILVDESDLGTEPRVLWALESVIKDGRGLEVSKRLQFVEQGQDEVAHAAGYAPYLDYRPLKEGERVAVESLRALPWLASGIEGKIVSHAIQVLVPEHYDEVKQRRTNYLHKQRDAVHQRLTTEIMHWDAQTRKLEAQEAAGKQPKMNADRARRRRDELEQRLETRMAEIDEEERLIRVPPIVIGSALIVPLGYFLTQGGAPADLGAKDTKRIELLAMDAVMRVERSLGFEPRDVSAAKIGYDIESKVGNGKLRFIEVKGRVKGAEYVTVTKNEMIVGLNKADDYILAIVEIDGDEVNEPRYIRYPFKKEPEWYATSTNCDMKDLLSQSTPPR